MPTIRIDEDVWSWLKSHARPFEDTPNSVLRRVAGLDQAPVAAAVQPEPPAAPTTPARVAASPVPSTAAQRGTRVAGRKTPQGAYRDPLLRILLRRGGCASRSQALRDLEQAMSDRLTDFDRSDIKSGTIRWQKSAEWEVSTMRQQGLLMAQAESPRGEWCLSAEGRRAAQHLPEA